MNRHNNNSNEVMVLIDIKNAFNCVDCSGVLQAVRHPVLPMTVTHLLPPPTRPSWPRPLPPCRYLGPTRPHLQCPLLWSKADWDSVTVFQHVEVWQIPLPRHWGPVCQHGAPLPTLCLQGRRRWSGGLGFLSWWLARESCRSTSLPSSDPSLSFAQRIPSTLHGENARAILKRSPGGLIPDRSSLGLQVLAEDSA